ncbi:hypothetical protein TIFTF001_005852 [Ficus carica]|uniref:Uncharacterized protein n=1 Tax=Ficus carica TaxID=3494 RepID=A0AA87ZLM7_FICCA|nr:hypothetical protein TIFTF001_005852 [Ficus carica]
MKDLSPASEGSTLIASTPPVCHKMDAINTANMIMKTLLNFIFFGKLFSKPLKLGFTCRARNSFVAESQLTCNLRSPV